jgi:hypothetical protein
MNYELNELIGSAADTVRFVKSRRIAWLCHVMRMDDKRTHKRILQWKPILYVRELEGDQGRDGL